MRISLTATIFAIVLVFSVFVSSGFSVPLTSAQYALAPPILSNGLSPIFSGEQGNPFLDSITGGLINQYPDSQSYPYQDSNQVPYYPTQKAPEESLPLEELHQENSVVDVTAPETAISSIVDGNNVPLQEGITTPSTTVVITIGASDDTAVTSFQCVLDNLQQDPSVCSTNTVVVENLQPGAHLFQASSVDAAGNVDTTAATFSWNVVVPALDPNFTDPMIPQELLPIPPLQQDQQQLLLPQDPFKTILPEGDGTTFYQHIVPQTSTTPSYLSSPPYPYLNPDALPLLFQQPSTQNISTLHQDIPTATASSLLPIQSGSQQQTLITNNVSTGANHILYPIDQNARIGVKNGSVFVPQNVLDTNGIVDATNPVLSPSFPTDFLPRIDSTNSTRPVFGSQLNQTVKATDITGGNEGNDSLKVPGEIAKTNTTTQNPSPTMLPSKILNIDNTNFPTFGTDNTSSDLAAPVSSSDLTAAATPILKDPNLRVQTVATGLNSPTSMAFLGPRDILVTEKNTGMVKRIKDNKVLSPPLLDVNVATNSERGLLGIDVQKLSSTQYYVFLYYTISTEDGGTAIANRLYRYLLTIGPNLGPAQGTMTSPRLLLNLPVSTGPNHDGGKVLVSPSGYIYTVLGDLNRNGKAQNFENGAEPDLTGGILRVTRDGNTVGTGILGTTHPLNKYVAYGIRNSFGIDIDPVTGYLWDTENGPEANDEINRIFGGYNSGWEDIMGMAPAGFNLNNLVNFGGKGTYSNPEFVWTQVVAPTAIEFLTSVNLGTQYRNDMFVGDFKNGRIYNFNLNSQRTALDLPGALSDRVANMDSETQSVIFGEGFGGISDLKAGAGWDGYLYVLSIRDGAIYRIIPNA